MSGIPWETVTLTTLSRDRGLFPALLAEARDIAIRNQEGKLVIHTPWGIEWKPFGLPRQKRPVDSVVLQEGVSETIKRDVTAFLQRRQWYADRGSCIKISLFIPTMSLIHFGQAFHTEEVTYFTVPQVLVNHHSYRHWPAPCLTISVFSTYRNVVLPMTS